MYVHMLPLILLLPRFLSVVLFDIHDHICSFQLSLPPLPVNNVLTMKAVIAANRDFEGKCYYV